MAGVARVGMKRIPVLSDWAARFGLFLVAGLIGFVVDAAVFFGLLHGFEVSILWSRLIASCVAVVTTWMLNRSYAFSGRRVNTAAFELAKYILASLTGAIANLLTLLAISPFDAAAYHVPSYVLGAISGLVVNYLLYDRFVFYGGRGRR